MEREVEEGEKMNGWKKEWKGKLRRDEWEGKVS